MLKDLLWLRKITMVPHTLAVVDIQCPDDRTQQLKIYVSEMILDNMCIAVAYVTMNCMI